ncbi:unnamed protein product [Didymodactylos carnosus]|uniref:NAD(P)(+)--arginine ADP-ribosyltransferase n=1 Tax=Didymodactylos carnosus TaxID=1234261 RepID=A0A815R4J8_9BILA|nr:unnamed protein product [Didymodactylos carnosus]CAF1470999.1 unnamed protein product [Didymodactylos carnosus]CAF4042519.1 unnamed protein product [Didymodactylos carnosus]CAF4338747.1 unnamed protein product [Didymodactylos carnosus]
MNTFNLFTNATNTVADQVTHVATNVLKAVIPDFALRVLEYIYPSEKMIKPVEKFETLAIVSLEDAVKPLIELVPEVLEMVTVVKEKCAEPKEGLTTDESAAIMLYSMEWQPREKSFYIILNNTLRSEDQEKLKPWDLYIKLFVTSLEKLPSASQTIYRGVKSDLSAQYPQGKIFVWWAFSSCTRSVQVLQSEQFLGKTGARTLFAIECKAGKDIRQHSLFPTEDEVLLIAVRKLQVASCLDSGNGLFIIQLKEVDSDHPLLGTSTGTNSSVSSASGGQSNNASHKSDNATSLPFGLSNIHARKFF